MQFEILSHAGLRVEHAGITLLVDPWVVGSSYWRSWWNYPPVDETRIRGIRPDFVYLSHIHWDHFHGPSLRLFGKDVHFLVPEDRYTRMRDDLKAMGFSRITEVPHGVRYPLAVEFSVTPFLFFPMTDSALAIEAGRTVVLDANDCKICGLPLRQIKQKFPTIDFVLRSHSSANTRVCREYLDRRQSEREAVDNKEDYLRSFANFMNAVRPRYAVPFASNHCHLHRDTRHFNLWQQTPKDVEESFRRYKLECALPTELVTMLPGSVWDEDTGFKLSSEGQWFVEREAKIAEYAERHADALAAYYDLEARCSVSDGDINRYFGKLFEHVPWFWRRRFVGRPVFIAAIAGERRDYWRIDMAERRATRADLAEFERSAMRIEMPAIVLKQALRMNMFAHAGISKRTKWRATTESMPLLDHFTTLLDFEEYELLPLHRNLSLRSLRVWMRRWREVLGYVQLIWVMKRRGVSGKEVEQIALLELS